MGAPGLANEGGRGAIGAELDAEFERRRRGSRRRKRRGGGVGRRKMDFGSQIGEFWCKLGAFCTVHLELV